MSKFRFTAARDSGERISGIIEGSDRSTVIGKLGDQGLHPIDVEIANDDIAADRIFSFGGNVVSSKEITIFTRELAWLLQAGITLNQALDVLAKDAFSSEFSGMIATIRTDIRKGRSFKDALSGAGVFSGYFLSMIEVGEATGTLAAALERITVTREREQRIRGRMTSALIYPSLLVTLSLGAIVFILISVVPSIKEMITGSGAPIPENAQLVIGVSDWLLESGDTLLVVLPITALLIALLVSRPHVRASLSSAAIHVPVIGPLLRKFAAVHFCRVLGTLISAGMTLPDSLKLVKPTTSNRRIARLIGEMEAALRQGNDFIVPLERSKVFPSLLARMLKIGNETGNLAASLGQVTIILEEELERALDWSLTLLGPIIILILSVFVAFIIMSLMGAIISINDLAF